MSNDKHFSEQWALTRLGVPMAWGRLSAGAPEIVVAVVDSGVADNHEDLAPLSAGTVIAGQTRDDDDHGTLIAGTVGAIRDNAVGIAGLAKVRIRPIKFCSGQVVPSADRGAAAIELARLADASVILLAWDVGHDRYDALKNAIAAAGSAGAVVVVAAGNHGSDNDKYPNWPANHGNMPHVITVMASDENEERASYSNYGKTTVHLAAPGTVRKAPVRAQEYKPRANILSTVPYYGPRNTGTSYPLGYREYRGTSAAAAQVAGLVALMRARHPGWLPQQVKLHLLTKARRVPALTNFCTTGGIADFDQATV